MSNRAVVYKGPNQVGVEDIGYPEMKVKGKDVNHGVILQILATNICGSDLHMYRGRTDLIPGTPIGHEITGMVIEKGSDVEHLEIGDIVSVPFNVACGRCKNCKNQDTHICLSVNDLKPGGAYGYAEMGPWQGGQAEYVFIAYADFQLLKFPDKEMAREKLIDLTMLSDIFPTGFHGALTAGVSIGSTVYIAGAGPVGLCAAISSYLLGASCVIIGDVNSERLKHAEATLGCQTIDLTQYEVIRDQIAEIIGIPEVDCVIDAIGFEAHGHGHNCDKNVSTDALDTCIEVSRAGGTMSVPGLYLPLDPMSPTIGGKVGRPGFEFGRAWDKAMTIATGQAPVMRYHRQLMNTILFERVKLSKVLNTTPIGWEQAGEAYQQFSHGVPQKFVFDPQGVLKQQVEAKGLKAGVLHV